MVHYILRENIIEVTLFTPLPWFCLKEMLVVQFIGHLNLIANTNFSLDRFIFSNPIPSLLDVEQVI